MKPGLYMLKWKRDGEFLTGLETTTPVGNRSGWCANWGTRKFAIGLPHKLALLLKDEWANGSIVLVRMKDHSGTSRNNKDR